jgi:myo-inositol-1-phosphate synthase
LSVGVLIVGLAGATANTFVSGALAGSPSERMGGSVLAASGLDPGLFLDESKLTFSGWDVDPRGADEIASAHGILPSAAIKAASESLDAIRALPAYVGGYDTEEARVSEHSRPIEDPQGAIEGVAADIEAFRSEHGLERCIVVLLGPPLRAQPVESGFGDTNSALSSSACYALGALRASCGVIDFTPNVTLEMPEVLEAATAAQMPLAGRDGNTGQSLLKTVLGQMFKIRNLRVRGWYSTNILGNLDGKVLSRPEHRGLKMSDKLGVLEPILGYEDFDHVVDISYYLPRGDDKEAWDNIDFSGWFGTRMTMKVNWLGSDSALAAPLITDLVKHVDHAMRAGLRGHLPHLGLYFKHPLGSPIEPLANSYRTLMDFYTSNDKEQ